MTKRTKTSATIPLETPLKLGEDTIKEVTLRKPKTGELRGLKLTEILQMDTNALMKLLPRITAPALSADQVGDLDPIDFVAMASEVVVFLAPSGQVAELTGGA